MAGQLDSARAMAVSVLVQAQNYHNQADWFDWRCHQPRKYWTCPIDRI